MDAFVQKIFCSMYVKVINLQKHTNNVLKVSAIITQ
jgi:hypothetical protein